MLVYQTYNVEHTRVHVQTSLTQTINNIRVNTFSATAQTRTQNTGLAILVRAECPRLYREIDMTTD